MDIYKEIRYKDKLKYVGHKIIDSLVGMGVPRIIVYRILAKKMGWPVDAAHFRKVHRIEDLERMVSILVEFRKKIKNRRKKKPYKKRPRPNPPKKPHIPSLVQELRKEKKKKGKRAFKDEVLSQDAYFKAMEELRLSRETTQKSWWKWFKGLFVW